MNAFRCLRLVARPTSTPGALLSIPHSSSLRPALSPHPRFTLPVRSFSLLNPHRPLLPLSSTLPSPSTSSSSILHSTGPETLDILPKISSHPALQGIQIRCGPRNTFNPSHFVRKRRHGFLSRLRTRNGRNLLKRRLAKKRSTLSH
ncbi:hypothetical protein BCR34DRAFT_119992 [Clohesyomyces aquaticus]|uniref:Large ribosomal subunit protein bL34m n=1 Tax=Clohesyomyces aquaticus TaxID=1231657 RepID=A0A1Y2A1J7_9PLEO|nr:hypothetical protein BCR34DRAFT_119992 [Clohesyomyces aquaticus]